MTPEQIAIVQDTWNRIRPSAVPLASRFYSRLFDLDPDLKPLFEADQEEKAQELIKSVEVTVDNLDRPEEIRSTLAELGASQFFYAGKEDDYDNAAIAMIWALERSMNGEFTLDVREAWGEALGMMFDYMRETQAEAA